MVALPISSCRSFPSGPQVLEEKWIAAANGNLLYARTAYPANGAGNYPAVILIPGGLGNGATFIEGSLSNALVSKGYAVIAFNAEGRGTGASGNLKSEGNEDYNGSIHQDDLKSVIEAMQAEPYVDPQNIGLVTISYGISMAAGCLARHPELVVKFLIDVEGPANSFNVLGDAWSLDSDDQNDKTEDGYAVFQHYSTTMDPSEANVSWWQEREAINWIGMVSAPYLRLQANWDHAQPPNQEYQTGFSGKPSLWYQNKHAVDMINTATRGAAPWTRMNGNDAGNSINGLYSFDKPALYYTGAFDFDSEAFADLLGNALEEMYSVAY